MGMLSYDDFINRVIQQESGGNARAVSPAGAIGLMQLMPATARHVAGELGRNDIAGLDEAGLRNALFDPKLNRQFGEHYMQGRLNRYDGNQLLAAIGYNAGDKRADAYRQSHDMAALPRETQGYVRGILGEDVFGGAGTDTLAGGGGADPMLGGSAAAGSPFEGASDRDKWVAWGQALSQAFRGRDNSEAMGRLSALEQQGVSQNKTYQALIKRGLDPATAEWAVRDPVVMREMVQQLFSPKSKNLQISEIFDPATGQPQKVLLDQATGEYKAIGGAKAAQPAGGMTDYQKAQLARQQRLDDWRMKITDDKAQAAPKFTEGQTKDAGWADRMSTAEANIAAATDPESPTHTTPNRWLNKIWSDDDNLMNSEGWQNYKQAKLEWIMALLRKDTGASINQKEFEDAERTYFPQPGEADSVVQAKALSRKRVQESLAAGSGGAYEFFNAKRAGASAAAGASGGLKSKYGLE